MHRTGCVLVHHGEEAITERGERASGTGDDRLLADHVDGILRVESELGGGELGESPRDQDGLVQDLVVAQVGEQRRRGVPRSEYM